MTNCIVKITLMFVIQLSFSADHHLRMAVEKTENGNLILWNNVGELPEKWGGVIVKRRPSGNKVAAWSNVVKKPVAPCVVYDVDWANIINDEKVRSIYEAKLRKKISLKKKLTLEESGKEDVIYPYFLHPSGTDFEKQFDYHRHEWSNFSRNQIGWDIDNALFIGMGYLDTNAEKEESYVYALFPVVNGNLGNTPIASIDQSAKNDYSLVKKDVLVKASDRRNYLKLTIEYKPANFKKFGVAKVKFYRQDIANASKPIEISSEWELGIDPNSNTFIFSYKDKNLSKEKEYIYKFVPVLITGKELTEAATIYHYKPKK